MKSAKAFFDWAFRTRAKTVMNLLGGTEMSPEKIFLSFCSHDPALVSYGPAGINASIKGIGFMPKPEYLEETLEAYTAHIMSFDPDDRTYSQRGLKILAKYMYAPEAHYRVDFSCFGSLEMAKAHSWTNYRANPEATVLFYQPPAISYELRGKMDIFDEAESGRPEIYQKFINAQHDVYHAPDPKRRTRYPAYVFRIREIYDNCASPGGFGSKMKYPYEEQEG